MRPPMTTMAKGRWTSELGPEEKRKGTKPRAATLAVVA